MWVQIKGEKSRSNGIGERVLPTSWSNEDNGCVPDTDQYLSGTSLKTLIVYCMSD